MTTPLKILKLVNGDEIIAVVQDGREHPQNNQDGVCTDNLIFVTNPLKLNTSYSTETKTHSVYLTVWIPAISDETIVIDKKQILTLGHPTEELEEHYYELMVINSIHNESESKNEDEGDDVKRKKYKKILKDHNFDDDDIQ
jgi:ATP-dependent protease Clp ATPase subunit